MKGCSQREGPMAPATSARLALTVTGVMDAAIRLPHARDKGGFTSAALHLDSPAYRAVQVEALKLPIQLMISS